MANEHGRSATSIHADIMQNALDAKTRRVDELEEALRKIVKPTAQEKLQLGYGTITIPLSYWREAQKLLVD